MLKQIDYFRLSFNLILSLYHDFLLNLHMNPFQTPGSGELRQAKILVFRLRGVTVFLICNCLKKANQHVAF